MTSHIPCSDRALTGLCVAGPDASCDSLSSVRTMRARLTEQRVSRLGHDALRSEAAIGGREESSSRSPQESRGLAPSLRWEAPAFPPDERHPILGNVCVRRPRARWGCLGNGVKRMRLPFQFGDCQACIELGGGGSFHPLLSQSEASVLPASPAF